MASADAPSFSKIVQVPTRIQWEVRCVFQLGNKEGNNRVTTNVSAAGKPLPIGKLPKIVTCGGYVKKKCKNEDKPGKARTYKSRIRKQRSLEKDPFENASENLNNCESGKKVQSETCSAAVVDARHPKTKDKKMAAVACSNCKSRGDFVPDARSQASNAIAMRGMKGALTDGVSVPTARRTVVSAFKNYRVRRGQWSSGRQPWTIQIFMCES